MAHMQMLYKFSYKRAAFTSDPALPVNLRYHVIENSAFSEWNITLIPKWHASGNICFRKHMEFSHSLWIFYILKKSRRISDRLGGVMCTREIASFSLYFSTTSVTKLIVLYLYMFKCLNIGTSLCMISYTYS